MRQMSLGKSGVEVPVVGQGTMGMGGYFKRDDSCDEESVRLMRMGMDKGMTFFDTAEIYGAGHSEELVGRAIEGRRKEAFIATKFSPEHSAYDEVIAASERSLKRLRTDYIDLYQTHWPNPDAPFEETLRALMDLLKERKIRYVGLSNPTMKQIRMSAETLGESKFVSVQQQYNLADRLAENGMMPVVRELGLSFIAYSPLCEGKIAPEDDRKKELETIAKKHSATLGQVALAWILSRPNTMIIPKASREAHLLANVVAANIELSIEEIKRIDELYAPNVVEIDPKLVDVCDAENRSVYKTVEEALENKNGMTPSPRALADDFLSGEMMRPIKVVKEAEGKYKLTEGRLRYWAWVIAHDGKQPVPAFIV